MSQILVIEDDLDIRESIRDVLELESYTVTASKNGQDALDYLNSGAPKPKIILLDIMMPIMDGYEFRKRQLMDDSFANIPTIILSADRNFHIHVSSMKIKDFLKKPIDLDRLLTIIRRHIP